jgi:rare lipoprotein A (peptidoglycan hydrolase)
VKASRFLIPVALVWIYSCTALQRPASHAHHTEPSPPAERDISLPEKTVNPNQPMPAPLFDAIVSVPVYQNGIASWYGGDFHGKPTSNGEVYDMNKLTAAHPSLPFNTIVEVENVENQKRVLVRINDRGPFLKNRIIDLSYKAAQRLDMADAGTGEVNLRVVRGIETPKPAPTSVTYFFLQLGAYAQKQNALAMLERLKDILPELRFDIAEENDLYKIISEKSIALEKIQELKERLTGLKIPCFLKQTIQ